MYRDSEMYTTVMYTEELPMARMYLLREHSVHSSSLWYKAS